MKDIFHRLRDGEVVHLNDPEFYKVDEVVNYTLALSPGLNASTSIDETRQKLSEIVGYPLDKSTTVFAPFHTNFGRFINIGKHVFINHTCSFLDMGGITLQDHVLIGPRVNLVTENHPLALAERRAMLCQPILIKRNAWIGAGATILPGVTIGENSVVAAGAVVAKDVPDNVVVGGVPAKILKGIADDNIVCNNQNQEKMKQENNEPLFPRGEKLPGDWFTGDAFLSPLITKDENNEFSAGSVTFEIGARTNWHTHPKGQVLIVTEGDGFYQEKGKLAQAIKKGDVVNIPKNTEHWHGASARASMTHIAITNFKEDVQVTWLQPVTDEDFNQVNNPK
jgi:acetyltransferase-like isoleucine patch superfamily enzyme/quercetin dioxygenase-like cupin family protein